MRRRSFAPFTQALLNLFVDVRQRGIDIYPDDGLATNPWQNFVLYEQSVMVRLAMLGRSWLVQPDAGDDGTLTNYQQFSLYEDFGQNDLFMPWRPPFRCWPRHRAPTRPCGSCCNTGFTVRWGWPMRPIGRRARRNRRGLPRGMIFGTPGWPPWRC